MTRRIKEQIHHHPITSRLIGFGAPTWLALAAAGPAFAVLVGIVALTFVITGWK